MSEQTSSSVLSSSEVAFPRGGASVLTPLEVKEISNEAARDVLFESSTAAKRTSGEKSQQARKKSKKSKKNTKESEEVENVITIESLSFKKLFPGTTVLGQISKVNKLDLEIAIGDNLIGYVPISSISDEITRKVELYQQESDSSEDEEEEGVTRTATMKDNELPDLQSIFKAGEWLRAKVTEAELSQSKKKRIQFTIEPENVNESIEDEDLIPGNLLQCSVVSVEDRGVILNTGVSGKSGFISNKELSNANIDLQSLSEGYVMMTSIAAKPTTRTISLRPATLSVSLKKNKVSNISSVDAIQPGIIVDALVAEITKEGITTKVFGMVDGTISLLNIGEYDLDSLNHKFTIGNSIKARVIAVLLKGGTKKLVLSILPRILSLDSQENTDALEAFPIGFVFDQVEVIGLDSNYIFVSTGTSSYHGQVHISKINQEKVIDDYFVGSKHKARVIGLNKFEGLLTLTMDPKIIDTKFMVPLQIPVGEYINGGEIIKVLPDGAGIQVKIFNDFDAFVPPEHMSDVRLVYPERKYKVGSKIKGRVLKVHGSKIFITLKKTLVNIEDDEVLSNFELAEIGLKTPATVEKFVHNGAIVSFFGNLRAFLPKNEISETFVKDAKDFLKKGQTVNVRIMDRDETQQRLIVTLKQNDVTKAQQSAVSSVVPGKTIVEASIVEKSKDKDSVIVEIEGSNLRGVIYAGQLSDGNYEQTRALYKKIQAGDKLEAVVLERDMKTRSVILSAKQSLINGAKNNQIPSQFSDVTVSDKVLTGYIKSVTNLGLFVAFGGKLTGLVLAKYATKNPNEDILKRFYKNQSVSCRVIRLDNENKRFLLSLDSEDKSEHGQELVNPVDSTKKLITDYTPGAKTQAKIKSIKGTQLNVQLADNLQGRLDITQCFEKWSDIKDKNQPLSQFHKDEILSVRVLGYHDAKNHTFLPISHRKSKNTILELTLLEKDPITEIKDVKVGSEHVAFVNNLARGFVWVSMSLSVKGRVSFMDLSDEVSIFEDLENRLPIGAAIKAKVKQLDEEHKNIILTSRKHTVTKFEDVELNKQYPARVLKVLPSFVLVELAHDVVASSYITDALNDYSSALNEVFHANDYTTATVLAVDKDSKKISVLLRTNKAVDKVINSVEDLQRGDVVKGFVKNVANNGVYVSLGRSVHGLVRVSDLSDSYLKDWKKYFKQHQPVVGKVVNCKEEGRVLITLKESEVNGELNVLKKFEDLKEGEVYEGSVRQVTDFGVFVKLDGTLNVSGLCHHSEVADNKDVDVKALFGEGDRVKVKILGINSEKKQLSLGMKVSYFAPEAAQNEESDDDVEMAESEEATPSASESSDESDEEIVEGAFEADSDVDHDDEETSNVVAEDSGMGLSTNGFDWTASILDQAQESDESSDDEDFVNKKKKKRSTKVVEDKTADINTRAPQSVSDFERMLIGSPNSSVLWMNYMSFQLQLSEIEKAREIGERALKTINYREEQEKLNIWIALLNLENTFGTKESLEDTFRRSCQYMEPLTMHQKLASIYTLSEKFDEATSLYKVMIKKFSKNVSVWVAYASYLLDRQMNDEVHEALAKAMQALPSKESIEVVKKFAQLEFTKGDPEQGRSLFEGLVADAPKRIDLWNVYLDQEIKLNDKSKVENLFERVITKKLTKKQAKFFFTKWLKYEEDQNDEKSRARVKAKAAEYVEAHT